MLPKREGKGRCVNWDTGDGCMMNWTVLGRGQFGPNPAVPSGGTRQAPYRLSFRLLMNQTFNSAFRVTCTPAGFHILYTYIMFRCDQTSVEGGTGERGDSVIRNSCLEHTGQVQTIVSVLEALVTAVITCLFFYLTFWSLNLSAGLQHLHFKQFCICKFVN